MKDIAYSLLILLTCGYISFLQAEHAQEIEQLVKMLNHQRNIILYLQGISK